MSSKNNKKKIKEQEDVAYKNFDMGASMAVRHHIFRPILYYCNIIRIEGIPYPASGLARVSKNADIYCNPKVLAPPKEWARAIAHCALHLAMEHFEEKENKMLWNIACDCVIEKFLSDLKFGLPDLGSSLPPGTNDEEKLYESFLVSGVPDMYKNLGTAGNAADMSFDKPPKKFINTSWSKIFASGLSDAVSYTVSDSARGSDGRCKYSNTPAGRAKSWFISSYPLLGAIAAEFYIIDDRDICKRMGISVAAISCTMQEIYINPAAMLSSEELRFVIAHELLHAALRHDIRHEWRDPYLWNVACDFVINGWLTEMRIGERPADVLYDADFKGLSAEDIYERIVTDMRKYRKLATLRGVGVGDILPGDIRPDADPDNPGVDLDDFYRRALAQGLEYHQGRGRGLLPAALVEEIRALAHPPINWDVDLARWFDEYFSPIEKHRSYARPSRRQSSTPSIPRPNHVLRQDALDGRTYGVVLDTSGSMDRKLLATALGAIASYSIVRDVPAVRVVFCDADAYDEGYMKPEDIADTLKVKGRGGTILQPGIDLLKNADDFPKDAPILIITDAECEDKLILYGREHAFLIPDGAKLPFIPKGKVFRMS